MNNKHYLSHSRLFFVFFYKQHVFHEYKDYSSRASLTCMTRSILFAILKHYSSCAFFISNIISRTQTIAHIKRSWQGVYISRIQSITHLMRSRLGVYIPRTKSITHLMRSRLGVCIPRIQSITLLLRSRQGVYASRTQSIAHIMRSWQDVHT